MYASSSGQTEREKGAGEEQKYSVEGFVKGCLKHPADKTVVLPVVTGINEVRHQDLLWSLRKEENHQRETEFSLEGPELVLQRLGCVLNLRCISATISRML